jgi:hypothetical protein
MVMEPARWLAAIALAVLVAATARGQEPGHVVVAPWARPSEWGRYVGYTVGGGCVHYRKAEPPHRDDGTWGWDYRGLFCRRVIAGWWHDRRYQGGTGAYQTDGPQLLHPVRP